MMLCI